MPRTSPSEAGKRVQPLVFGVPDAIPRPSSSISMG